MAEVRAALLGGGIDTPLASNVAVTSFAHLPETIERDAVQIVLCDHHFWGGMRQVQHLGKLCQTFGLALSMHSNSHLGISLMAMTHVAAATKNLTYACDTHYPWQTSDEVIVGEPAQVCRGQHACARARRIGRGHRPGPARSAQGTVMTRSRIADAMMRPRCASTSIQAGSVFCRVGRVGLPSRYRASAFKLSTIDLELADYLEMPCLKDVAGFRERRVLGASNIHHECRFGCKQGEWIRASGLTPTESFETVARHRRRIQ